MVQLEQGPEGEVVSYFVEVLLSPPAIMVWGALAFMWLTAVPDRPIARWRWVVGYTLAAGGILYYIGALVYGVWFR